jgi:hypothetical protein
LRGGPSATTKPVEARFRAVRCADWDTCPQPTTPPRTTCPPTERQLPSLPPLWVRPSGSATAELAASKESTRATNDLNSMLRQGKPDCKSDCPSRPTLHQRPARPLLLDVLLTARALTRMEGRCAPHGGGSPFTRDGPCRAEQQDVVGVAVLVAPRGRGPCAPVVGRRAHVGPPLDVAEHCVGALVPLACARSGRSGEPHQRRTADTAHGRHSTGSTSHHRSAGPFGSRLRSEPASAPRDTREDQRPCGRERRANSLALGGCLCSCTAGASQSRSPPLPSNAARDQLVWAIAA